MTWKEYDGTLAVACIILAVLLNALQVSFIADGLAMASGQGYALATAFAIVVSFGLMFSLFAAHRLLELHLPQHYSWTLTLVASLLTGIMASWSLSYSAGMWTGRWWFGVFLGSTIPAQTVVLCKLAIGMLELSGFAWWKSSQLRGVLSLVFHALPFAKSETRRIVGTAEDGLVGRSDAPAVVPNPAAEAKATVLQEALEAPSPELEQQRFVVLNNGGVATITLDGERLSLYVGANLPKGRWEDLQSELRSLPFIAWDEVSKTDSPEGDRARMLEGVILVPKPKGKKNPIRRLIARRQHLDSVTTELRELLRTFSK